MSILLKNDHLGERSFAYLVGFPSAGVCAIVRTILIGNIGTADFTCEPPNQLPMRQPT